MMPRLLWLVATDLVLSLPVKVCGVLEMKYARSVAVKSLVRLINIIQSPDGIVQKTMSTKVEKINYVDQPATSLCLQFFNKKGNIGALWEGMCASGAEEIIILEDGSSDGSLSDWEQLAKGKNHFIVRSNDIFEVRSYDRAIDFARGRIVALLQDDDIPPMNGRWLSDAVNLFNQFDDLAILGGRSGVSLLPRVPQANGDGANYTSDGTVARAQGLFKYEITELSNPEACGVRFQFAEAVNRAPMLVRRDAIRSIGGIDQSFAPFQCDDVELCLRAWRSGRKVGLYDAPFARNVGVGGMRLYNKDSPNVIQNWNRVYELYGDVIESGEVASLVADANNGLAKQI